MLTSLKAGIDNVMGPIFDLMYLQIAATTFPCTSSYSTSSMLQSYFIYHGVLVLFALKTCLESAVRWAKCTSGQRPDFMWCLGPFQSKTPEPSCQIMALWSQLLSKSPDKLQHEPSPQCQTHSLSLNLISTGMNKQMKQMISTLYCRSVEGLASRSDEKKWLFASTELGQP